MGLTQIDLIKQILLFSSAVSAISARNYQSSRRWRRKGKYNKRRRCLTMLNRWQAHKGAACGKVAPIIMCLEVAQHCSTSSTPNDSEVSAPRRLRYRSTSGYAWFAISDGTSSLRVPGVLLYALTASHHISLRRHSACTTARAVAISITSR